PAFGDAATPEQIRAVVRYARSLCGEPGWPPGELNFPRAFVVEKAYPEDEVVITDEARAQEFIYEHRLCKPFQMGASARTAFDGLPNSFDGATAALKFNAWHSLERRALASLGVEVTPPLGRQTLWEVEPFFAFGASLAPALVVQGQLVTSAGASDAPKAKKGSTSDRKSTRLNSSHGSSWYCGFCSEESD